MKLLGSEFVFFLERRKRPLHVTDNSFNARGGPLQ